MNLKTLTIILAIIAILGIGYAVYSKIVQPTESMRGLQINFEFTPRQTFGCADYHIPKDFKIDTNVPKSVQKMNK